MFPVNNPHVSGNTGPNRSRSFGIRALFAVMAGLAFTAFLLAWAAKADPSYESILSVSCWAVCANLGLLIAARRQRSLLLGSLLGGSFATLVCYICLLLQPPPATLRDHLVNVGSLLCIAGTASGVLACVVGLLLNGFHLRSTR